MTLLAALYHASPSLPYLKTRVFLYQEEVIQLWVHSLLSVLTCFFSLQSSPNIVSSVKVRLWDYVNGCLLDTFQAKDKVASWRVGDISLHLLLKNTNKQFFVLNFKFSKLLWYILQLLELLADGRTLRTK